MRAAALAPPSLRSRAPTLAACPRRSLSPEAVAPLRCVHRNPRAFRRLSAPPLPRRLDPARTIS